MRDLLVAGKPAKEDLSTRMADNVVEALINYMAMPSEVGAEQVHALSTALSSLSLLAIAESLRTLADALTTVGDSSTAPTNGHGAADESWAAYQWPNEQVPL